MNCFRSVAYAKDYNLAANRARKEAEAAERDIQSSIAELQQELSMHPDNKELREMLVKYNQTTTVPDPTTGSWDWLTEDSTEAPTEITTESWREWLDEQESKQLTMLTIFPMLIWKLIAENSHAFWSSFSKPF